MAMVSFLPLSSSKTETWLHLAPAQNPSWAPHLLSGSGRSLHRASDVFLHSAPRHGTQAHMMASFLPLNLLLLPGTQISLNSPSPVQVTLVLSKPWVRQYCLQSLPLANPRPQVRDTVVPAQSHVPINEKGTLSLRVPFPTLPLFPCPLRF